jgi:hypothetical protein
MCIFLVIQDYCLVVENCCIANKTIGSVFPIVNSRLNKEGKDIVLFNVFDMRIIISDFFDKYLDSFVWGNRGGRKNGR